MERTEFYQAIGRARGWLSNCPITTNEKTLAQYRAAFDRMRARHASPFEMANGNKRSFYFYRASLLTCLLQELDKAIKGAISAFEGRDHNQCDLWLTQIVRYSNVLRDASPDPKRERKNLGEPGIWAQFASERNFVSPRRSKNRTLSTLPQDWRAQIWNSIPSKSAYRLAVAVLACTGCRPGELEKGIGLVLVGKDIEFTICGIKTHNGQYGQAWRKIVISCESIEAKFLADALRKAGGHLNVMAKARPVKDAIGRISRRIWPKRSTKNHVSPYCYRHQFASDMKAQGLSDEEIAQALGHSVDETQRLYGHVRRGRPGGNRVRKVSASRSVRNTRRRPPNHSIRKTPPKP